MNQQFGNVVIDGKRFETVCIHCTEDRPTIVMLHQALGSITQWRDVPLRIAHATGCGVLAYSRLGHGRSDPPTEKRSIDYLHREAEVVLPALLKEFGVGRPILYGHSDGASISLIYAATFPESARAIVVEAPHSFVEDATIAGLRRARGTYVSTDLSSRLGRYHDRPDELFWAWNDTWLDPGFREWNIVERLAAIRCPVLVLQGENDEYGTVAQADVIKSAVPHAEVMVIKGCGHIPHLEQKDAVVNRIGHFVRQLVIG